MAPEPHLGESDAHCPTQEGAEARHLQGGRRHSDHLLHRSGARPAGGVYERRSVDARPEAEAVTAPCGFWSATWSVALDMFFAGGGGSGRKSAKSQAAVLPTEGAPVRGRPYLREYHRRLRFRAFPSHSRRAHPETNRKRRSTSHSRTHHGNSAPSWLKNRPLCSALMRSSTSITPRTLTGISRSASAPPMSVFTQPGCSVTTRMPRSFRSSARLLTTAFSAALLDRYR